MKTKLKKITALLLVIMMLVMLIPVGIFAKESEEVSENLDNFEEQTQELSDIKISNEKKLAS